MSVTDADRYLTAVIADYRERCDSGFSDEYAAKGALWKAAVVVLETASDPEPWLDQLRAIARDVSIGGKPFKASRIESVIRSARRRG